MIKTVLAVVLMLFTAPATGQIVAPATPDDLAEIGEDIPLDKWLGMTEGRTVWYYTSGALWGREYYHPGAGYVTFQYYTGECRQARWSFADGIYCFDFRDGPPHCFRHLSEHGRIWALPVNGGAAQAVVFIDDSRPDCGPGPSS
jgi:hypothetical protein